MAKAKRKKQYFLVGATWGNDDRYSEFIKKGIWRSGWGSEGDKFRSVLEEVKEGDRIAIKKGLGRGDSRIAIRAIGIVKAIDLDEEYCTLYVDWLRVRMSRKVRSKGCYKTIHGPYSKYEDKDTRSWIEEIFCI